MPRQKARGFTLIEVMIVVVIIGLLASLAIPNFIRLQCRARQSEAKMMTKQLMTPELVYSGEFGTYLDLADLTTYGGIDPTALAGTRYYSITLRGGPTSYNFLITDTKEPVNGAVSLQDTWLFDSSVMDMPSHSIDTCSM